ncbi:tetratricopeptide repeat protein [Qipengyuania sp. ASV99]|uniref:tetratricopeptide repeat protein n=1 Tax=Qipengyuania sp. ASV99 TaxID=3399681 RepID=UPI003A4C803E
MPLIQSLLLAALQIGPNPLATPLPDGHDELRERPPRETGGIEGSAESEWLAQCLALVAEDAARAHTLAQLRRNESAGAERVLANHCLGLAATELTLWDDAIAAFSAARDDTPADELRVRARFGAMAGNAALASGDPVRAEVILRVAQDDAVNAASAPMQAIAASDLARALVAQDRADEALAQLETATSLQPQVAEGWLLKATLLRRLERLGEAQTAIERASQLTPMEPQVGLEAGVIAVLSGRQDAARASWQSVIDLQPDGAAAEIARDYLGQLGPDAATTPEEAS